MVIAGESGLAHQQVRDPVGLPFELVLRFANDQLRLNHRRLCLDRWTNPDYERIRLLRGSSVALRTFTEMLQMSVAEMPLEEAGCAWAIKPR